MPDWQTGLPPTGSQVRKWSQRQESNLLHAGYGPTPFQSGSLRRMVGRAGVEPAYCPGQSRAPYHLATSLKCCPVAGVEPAGEPSLYSLPKQRGIEPHTPPGSPPAERLRESNPLTFLYRANGDRTQSRTGAKGFANPEAFRGLRSKW